MLKSLKNKSTKKTKIFFNGIKINAGFTYVELIIVLSISALMSAIVLFNYGKFQAAVDIKVLANDIALQIVQAQKDSINGKLPTSSQAQPSSPSVWKPSYGVYFDSSSGNNKTFNYFIDSENTLYTTSGSNCNNIIPPGQTISLITIPKGSYIKSMIGVDSSTGTTPINKLSILFKRPNASALFCSDSSAKTYSSGIDITVQSGENSSTHADILIYPSGRVQIQ